MSTSNPFVVEIIDRAGDSLTVLGDSLQVEAGGAVTFRRLQLVDGQAAEPAAVILSPHAYQMVTATPASSADVAQHTRTGG